MKWLQKLQARSSKKAASRLQLTSPTQSKGQFYEQRAQEFLEQQGLRFLERNYRCKLGEIDLIMRDDDCLVFIEVRYRTSQQFGGALESISQAKQLKIKRAASTYLSQTKMHNTLPCRFDVVTFSHQQPNWIQNAFNADSL